MIEFKPIGYVQAAQQYKYQQPRQGEFASNKGKVVLEPGLNFEQAVEDLAGFDKIWLVYVFHQNQGWHPKVDPPVCPDGKKKGVFATRSPYRPNSIGLSCVDLKAVKGRQLMVENFDLLDGTPILDIKPYISHYDSHPEASLGWIPEQLQTPMAISFSADAGQAATWIMAHEGPDLFDLAKVQLSVDPLNQKRKRVRILDGGKAELAFRTWRLLYFSDAKNLEILSISSGYSQEDLLPGAEDKYGDKDLHRSFGKRYST